MFTLNYFGNIVEVSLWLIANAIFLPYALYANALVQGLKSEVVDTSMIRIFSLFAFLQCVVFISFVSIDHVPYMYRMWQEDVQLGKSHMDLWDGIYSSLFDRIKSQSMEDWKDELVWQASYFSLGTWVCLYCMSGPRLLIKKGATKTHNE